MYTFDMCMCVLDCMLYGRTFTQVHRPVIYMHTHALLHAFHIYVLLGECMALWGKPNEPNIQHLVYIFMQCIDS